MTSWRGILTHVWTASVLLHLIGVEGGCPDEPRGETRTYKRSCYEFIKQKYTQPEAQKLCYSKNGRLVHIYNKDTQSWLETTITEDLGWLPSVDTGNAGIWLGLIRSSFQTWSWAVQNDSDRAEGLDYTNWDEYEPDPTSNRKCALFGHLTKFLWRASLCEMWPNSYYVICQYDAASGVFGRPGNLAGFVVGMVLLAIIIGAALSFYYCYLKRRAVLRRLHEHDLDSPTTIKKELNTNNIGDVEVGSYDNIHAPPCYGEVQPDNNTNYNLNIIIGSNFEQPKVRDKDLSLTDVRVSNSLHSSCAKPQYSRSMSEPAPSANPTPQYFSSLASAPPLEEVGEEDSISEHSPLQTDSSHSQPNNLS